MSRNRPDMYSATTERWVGAATILVMGVALALAYGSDSRKPAGGYDIRAVFNRVDGLALGDEVRLGGIKVGVVADQRLLEGSYRAALTLRIDDGVTLPADTSAAIHTDGLFGTKFVVLEPGGDSIKLMPGASIDFTQDSMVVEDLLDLIISQGKAKRGT